MSKQVQSTSTSSISSYSDSCKHIYKEEDLAKLIKANRPKVETPCLLCEGTGTRTNNNGKRMTNWTTSECHVCNGKGVRGRKMTDTEWLAVLTQMLKIRGCNLRIKNDL